MPLELSFQEVEELLERVIHNKYLVEVENAVGPTFAILCSPKAEHILQSRYIRSKALLEAEAAGLPSAEDTRSMADKAGLITEEDSAKLKEVEEKIKAQKRVLQMTKIEGRRKSINEVIEGLEQQIRQIETKRDKYYMLSREYKADEEAVLFLAWAGTLNVEGEQYWKSFQDFENERDLIFRNSIVDAFADFNRGIPTARIRYLARHTLWRIRYTAALKTGGPLFPGGLPELTPDQQSLLYWSNYYQSIYEMMPDDQPDDDTINDDEALDAYMESYFKRREQERSQSRLQSRSRTGKLSATEKDEVIITAAHPDYLTTAYSEDRIKGEGSDVEVIAPNSRRARNRREGRRARRSQ
jgi:hypothetical protein